MGSKKYQYLGTICVNLISIGYGAVCGWPSASTLLLMSDETPLEAGKITMAQASWITAMICVGGMLGNCIFGWITNRFGRKIPLLMVAVPQIVSWAMILFATNVTQLYIARFLAGFSGGGLFVILPLFIAEISEDKIRGTLGSCLVLSANTGILLIFLLGHYASYEFAPKVLIVIELIFLCVFPFFPESPQYLLKMNRAEEAERSLRFYRGINGDENSESEMLHIELDKLKAAFSEGNRKNVKSASITLADFKSREAKKSFLIAYVLALLNQFCGCFAMISYTASIFVEAGSDLNPNMAAVIVGAIQLLGSYVSLLLVDKAGRKFLISVSALGIFLGQICLGTYAFLKAEGFDVSEYGWVTVASFSFVIFLANWGVLSLPFVVMAEIIPEKIRNFGTSSGMFIIWLSAFFVLRMFPVMSDALGMGGCMFLFSSLSLAGAIFVAIVMPETKGRSFEAIAELLRK